MDIAAAGKTPEADSDSTARIQGSKLLPFSNGVLKQNHHAAFNNNPHQAAGGAVFVYKECLKNHAASLGAHAVDGCGEFMPSPTANSADPTSLKCAACGCHRNFHRREPEDAFPFPNTTAALEYQPHHRHHPPPPPPPPPHEDGGSHSSPSSPSPPPISSSYYPSAPHLLLTLSGGMSAASTPQDHITPVGNRTAPAVSQQNGRKRFRTRFTQDQKEKMLGFAEKLGWKMQKRDEELIAGFCNEIGVEKGVFKVWMHNNKNNSGKREPSNAIPSSATTAANDANGVEFVENYHQNHGIQNEEEREVNRFQEEGHNRGSDSFSGRVAGPNGSSSSS